MDRNHVTKELYNDNECSLSMKPSFRFLPNIAIADVAFEARAPTLNELFEIAAQAAFEVMAKTSTIKPTITKELSLTASTLENLLYDFLSEIIFLKDTESLVFCEAKVAVKEGKDFTLKATLKGDAIDHERQELGNDVKAVTMHMFEVKKEKDAWKARVVLDI